MRGRPGRGARNRVAGAPATVLAVAALTAGLRAGPLAPPARAVPLAAPVQAAATVPRAAPAQAAATTPGVAVSPPLPASGASAPYPPCPLGLAPSATESPAGGAPFEICSGRVRSFDGTPLDLDLSLPAASAAPGPRPLVVMLNGWGASKTDFESATLAGNGQNTWHWNNAWFASRGYAVLNYTSRGFHRSCGQDPSTGYTYLLDPACKGRASWTHLADRRWEVHDTQYLVGLLVDAGVARPDQVVVTGDSYGGGQSWLLALSQDQVMMPSGRLVPWRSPRGVPIHLAAAVPQYPRTDLPQALVQNGRGSDGFHGAPPDGPHETPVGVEKESYVSGLFADGAATAQFSTSDPTADLPAWFAAIAAGEPYSPDPEVATALHQLQAYRSPNYMPVPPPALAVPVFDIQGVTDPLFPAIQALELENKLYRADPRYPVWSFFGDVGHAYADNPHAAWTVANDEANAFLAQVLSGRGVTLPRYTVATVACLPGQRMAIVKGSSFAALAPAVWQLGSSRGAETTSLAPPGEEAVAADPLAGARFTGPRGCRTVTPATGTRPVTDPGVAAWTFKVPSSRTILGAPVVRVTAHLVGTSAEVAARLWEVDPATGAETLITRTVYRLGSSTPTSTQHLAFELWPTAWPLAAGHLLKLELTQVDSPTWRPDNLPSLVAWSGLRLSVPLR